MSCKHYIIHGRVQGVFFRAWTQDAALRLGLNGWVRNLPDGSVEALAAGDEALLARFEAALRQGPPASRVDRVESAEAEAWQGEGFAIRR